MAQNNGDDFLSPGRSFDLPAGASYESLVAARDSQLPDHGNSPENDPAAAAPPTQGQQVPTAAEGDATARQLLPQGDHAAVTPVAAQAVADTEGDNGVQQPMEWLLPGGAKAWMPVTPWFGAAALLEMWDLLTPSEIALPPEVAVLVHAMLAQCNGCLHRGRTCPSLMVRGRHVYYSDSSAQCPGCTKSKVTDMGRGRERIVRDVWREVSEAEVDALSRHTFAAVLYPTTRPGMAAHVLRSGHISELRVCHAHLLRTAVLRQPRGQLQALSALYLDRCSITAGDLVALRPIAGQLRRLSLTSNSDLETLRPLTHSLVELRWLDLSNCDLEDRGMCLEDLAVHNRLEEFYAFGSRLMHVGKSLRKIASLRVVGLSSDEDDLHNHLPLGDLDGHMGLRRIVLHWDATAGYDSDVEYTFHPGCLIFANDAKHFVREGHGRPLSISSTPLRMWLPYWERLCQQHCFYVAELDLENGTDLSMFPRLEVPVRFTHGVDADTDSDVWSSSCDDNDGFDDNEPAAAAGRLPSMAMLARILGRRRGR